MPGKPRTLHLADTRVCRFHLYDKPTIQQLSRCSGTRTADRAFGRLSGLSLVPNYFAGGFQFRRSVIEELTASSVVTLIRSWSGAITCKSFKVLLTGTQEIEKINSAKFTSLRHCPTSSTSVKRSPTTSSTARWRKSSDSRTSRGRRKGARANPRLVSQRGSWSKVREQKRERYSVVSVYVK